MRVGHGAIVAMIALASVAGCGSGEPAGDRGTAKVATVAGDAGTPSASASARTPERPRERLDTTPAEFEAMLRPYEKCMAEHGARKPAGKPAKGDVPRMHVVTPAEQKREDDANRVCEPRFYPLPPWERDPANTEARDFAVAVVRCLKAKGVEYVTVGDGGLGAALGGDDNDARSIRLGLQYMPECEREVAKKTK
ncbi:hypothetical protein Asp14428_12220 [Actinoplanes sp. NBRC 14428]|nr:hypothetical protein Asp14428_12220 [Actinoplanes sp. NBRC 14428]